MTLQKTLEPARLSAKTRHTKIKILGARAPVDKRRLQAFKKNSRKPIRARAPIDKKCDLEQSMKLQKTLGPARLSAKTRHTKIKILGARAPVDKKMRPNIRREVTKLAPSKPSERKSYPSRPRTASHRPHARHARHARHETKTKTKRSRSPE